MEYKKCELFAMFI